jgi:hypothetical protein
MSVVLSEEIYRRIYSNDFSNGSECVLEPSTNFLLHAADVDPISD